MAGIRFAVLLFLALAVSVLALAFQHDRTSATHWWNLGAENVLQCIIPGDATYDPDTWASDPSCTTYVETTVDVAASADDTEIVVADATGFAEGYTIAIGIGEDTRETNTISTISAETFTLDTALESDHDVGERVGGVDPATSHTVNEPADMTTSAIIPHPSSQFAAGLLVSFYDEDFQFVAGDTLPLGAVMGRMTSDTFIGKTNNPCNTNLSLVFAMLNGTTDTSHTFVVDPDHGNILDDDCEPGNDLPNHVDCYPDYNNRVFDPDGPGCKPPIAPLSRLTGYSTVAGADILVQFMVFDKGAFTDSCVGGLDDDGDTNVNDGCPVVDDPEDPSCVNIIDDGEDAVADGFVNDGCPKKASDDDGDTTVNDGCTVVGHAEDDETNPCNLPGATDNCGKDAACDRNDAIDDDGDTTANDGCPKVASDDDTDDAAETTAGRRVNDGCPAVATSEKDTAGWCDNDLDDDGDTTVNDGCDPVGTRAEADAECIDPETLEKCVDPEVVCDGDVDDDGDTRVNDGCPAVGVSEEDADECADDVDDDGDTKVNDGCPAKDDPEGLGFPPYEPPHPYSQFTAAWGYPSVIMLLNPADPAAPSPINYFCSPMTSVSTLYGMTQDFTAAIDPQGNGTAADEGGHVVRKTPAATGTAYYHYFGLSYRNADGDPYPTNYDSCKLCYNYDDQFNVDSDGDGIDPCCDPDGATNAGDDYDSDGYTNCNDYCPLIYNPYPQTEGELSAPWPQDAGPRQDEIADDCEGDGQTGTPIDYVILPEARGCLNAIDDDAIDDGTPFDTVYINDGCPIVGGAAETDCGPDEAAPLDDDGDTRVNDGCIAIGSSEDGANPYETSYACSSGRNVDDDQDGWFDEGCDSDDDNANGTYNAALVLMAMCIGETDSDDDGWCDDDETALGSPPASAPGGDHDGDKLPNYVAATETAKATNLWTFQIKNNTGTTVTDVELDMILYPPEDTVGVLKRTLIHVASVSGGSAPDTWQWEIDAEGTGADPDDCATDSANRHLEVERTGATTLGPGATLTINVQTCGDVSDLRATFHWTASGAPVRPSLGVDNCPVDYNPSQADADGDGIGDACDLYPHIPSDGDYDNDGYNDDSDPCPQQLTTDPIYKLDNDGDGIGNRCDPMPNVDHSPFGRPENISLEYAAPLNDAGAKPIPDEKLGMDGVQQVCDDGIDNDGDTDVDRYDSGCSQSNDFDNDYATDAVEWWVGADPLDDCSDDCNAAAFTATHHGWAFDVNDDCWANSSDIIAFSQTFIMPIQKGTLSDKPYKQRFDVAPDNWINSSDIIAYSQSLVMPLQCFNP